MFNLDDCIACITSRSAKAIAQNLEKRLEGYNVTRVQFIAMYYIGVSDEKITQKSLADKMGLKEPTIVRLLDRMEKEDFIIRECVETDKRIKVLSLTEKGEQLNKKLIIVAENFKNQATENISNEDLTIYKEVLAKMLLNTK